MIPGVPGIAPTGVTVTCVPTVMGVCTTTLNVTIYVPALWNRRLLLKIDMPVANDDVVNGILVVVLATTSKGETPNEPLTLGSVGPGGPCGP